MTRGAKPTPRTRIWSTIDLQRHGKESGYLRLPFSTENSAYGTIAIPICCIRNGQGPTALLIAGNHGDEYEGQVALSKLVQSIAPADIRGRIIILPHLNLPAAKAGRRLSPLDDGNLNRLFPGDPNGSPTQMIADYVSSVLLPMADVLIDLHSGGRSLDYFPCSLIRLAENSENNARIIDIATAFGAPICSISDGSGGGGATTLSATAQLLDVPALTAELGGGSGFSQSGAMLAMEGTLRVLDHVGNLRCGPEKPARPMPGTRFMRVVDRDSFIYAPGDGIFEPVVDVGTTAELNAVGGYLHGLNGETPIPVAFPRGGLVACKRAIALTREGDCLFKILNDLDWGTIADGTDATSGLIPKSLPQ
jgi:uncharacterized protein